MLNCSDFWLNDFEKSVIRIIEVHICNYNVNIYLKKNAEKMMNFQNMKMS